MDEGTLVKKLNRHSRSALEQAVVRFTPYVGAVIAGVLAGRACREDVEELSADVFLALWAHREELDPEQGLRPWLGTVARNKAREVARDLGLGQSAAKQRLLRGRKKLKERLTEGGTQAP